MKIFDKAYRTTRKRGSMLMRALLILTRVVTNISRLKMREPRLLIAIEEALSQGWGGGIN